MQLLDELTRAGTWSGRHRGFRWSATILGILDCFALLAT
jgi:hypothetical protein